MADKKIGCYVCTGCGIGDALDIDALVSLATDDCDADVAKTHECLCGDDGIAMLRKEIADEGVTNVLVTACSSRAKKREFNLAGALIDRVSIREAVTWIMEPNDEDTQMAAEDYIRMACARAKEYELPECFQEGDFYKDLLVVGGGAAGLTAALESAKAGYKVSLVEKTATLGGFVAKLNKSVPLSPPYGELEETTIGALIDEVKAHDKIDIYLEGEIAKTAGSPCKFAVDLKAGGNDHHLKIGAIIMATGFEPYDATKLGHLGYGKYPDVVTNVEFEEMAKNGKLVRPSDGQPIGSVLFLQCAGSRDPDHLPYCSAVCCRTALKQALYVKENNAEAQAFVLYKDIRTPGQAEDFYRKAQEVGTVFIRGELEEIGEADGKLVVQATDLLLDDSVVLTDLDMVVLATGMVSTNIMDGENIEPLEGDDLQHGKILNLEYRQGPELPNLKYGSPDSHYICFPYETRRTGIYATGTVRRPMDSATARRDATGAALKAIQAVEQISKGRAVHPRAGDESFPEFFLQRCTQCKRCTEECPFGAINEDEKGNPMPNPTRCRRCGICMGACPERIISFKNYSVPAIGNSIKAIEVPDEDEEKPRVLAFMCENDAYPLFDQIAQNRTKISPFIRVIPLRCIGSTNLVWIADALSGGIDGMLFFGCKHGDDYQCHYVKGSAICETRLKNIQDTLDRLVLESERIRYELISIDEVERMPQIMEEFMEKMEEVGPNPYKGF